MDGKKMTITDTQTTAHYGLLQLSYTFNHPLPGYPFYFDLSIDYILSGSRFTMQFHVTNNMESTPMPFYMGWHPYFRCVPNKAYVVVLDPCTSWNHVELDANMDPTGETTRYHGLN